MRIVGGAFSGRKLTTIGAGAPEAQLRPTTDRVREAMFNLLEHGDYPPIKGARVLDLFAGIGALGLEAISRGAERALFVDDHPKARAFMRENIELLAVIGATKVFRRDATRLGPNRGAPYSVIFLDPPYGKNLAAPAMQAALEGGWAAPGAVFVLECALKDAIPEIDALKLQDERRYGETKLAFFRAQAE